VKVNYTTKKLYTFTTRTELHKNVTPWASRTETYTYIEI